MPRCSKLHLSAYVVFGLLPALLLCSVSGPILYGGLRLYLHGHLYEWRQAGAMIAWPAGVLVGTVASTWVMFIGPASSRPARIIQTLLLACGLVAGLAPAFLDPALLLFTIGPALTAIVLLVRIWRQTRDTGGGAMARRGTG